ncbi:MAG: GDSL-type esterase/lipase family protein [Eubacteriales bacterium]|nr:GDSL-type esterase/lipase family protein [Eubacteriales bacterium]
MNMKKNKIVFIGNSIVNGFPHRRSECFASLYREASGAEVINKGVNGETSPQALSRFSQDVLAHKPDKVVFLGGTNDYIYGICSPEETLSYYKKIAALSKENGIEPIFLIPLFVDSDMASKFWIAEVDYAAVNESLKELRNLMISFGTKEAIRILDTQTYFLGLYTKETCEDYLRDGLHPTVLGHEKIADFLLKEL